MTARCCPVCSGPVVGSHLKVYCSPPCKVKNKREYDARYRSENDEIVRARRRRWYANNKDRKRVYDANRRNGPLRQHILATSRSGHAARMLLDADKVRLSKRLAKSRRRARLKAAGVFLVTPRDIERMRFRQSGECAYCPEGLLKAELDHVVPIARGGSHGVGNIVLTCPDCNRRKSAHTVMEWRLGKPFTRKSFVPAGGTIE